ncbi:hypothetical protein [Mameliella alba]|uniref:Cytidylyltransferase family protein n=1 Tax=Mameliella alba TaxID=561184 RepID=A0A0B3S3N4_9RHOB|nr:hypothetical protein [Mameliella alba]KHQ53578.1 Cytidylyltransferase family protein [Mameliella alba]
MSILWQSALALGLILGLLGIMTVLSRVARRGDWHPELARKIVHVLASGLAIPLPWLFVDDWPVWLVLGLALSAMVAMRTPLLAGPGRALHSVERKSWGDVLLVVSVGLLFLLQGAHPVLYILPLSVVALGDAAAALAGSAYGRNFYLTPDGRKSVEGSTMFLLVTLILAMICLLLLTDMGRGELILAAFCIALFATVIEADSWAGLDNLFLPMGVYLFLVNFYGWPDTGGLMRLVAVALAMPLAYGLSRAAGTTGQIARIHAVALFMILCAVHVWNAVLPGLVLLGHALLLARQGGDGTDRGALNVVTGLAAVSFAFLAIDVPCGASGIGFYGIGCAAIAAGLVSHGLPDMARGLRLGAGLAACGTLWLLWFLLGDLNVGSMAWHAGQEVQAAVLILLAGLLPQVWPALFQRGAEIRITVLGALPALCLYGGNCLLNGGAGT